MKSLYSKLFHEISKENVGDGGIPIPADDREWPEAWKTVEYKDYRRFAKIPLDDTAGQADFFQLIQGRKSHREFSRSPIEKAKLSTILKYSCGISEDDPNGNPRRAQPSGGARYPIEVYAIVLVGSGEVPAGLHHYNVKAHALDVLWKRTFEKSDIDALCIYPYTQAASCLIVMTAIFERTQMKYGERGYRYALLEAGHIGQNIYLASQAAGLGCTATGTWDRNLEKLIDIDGITESVLYTLAIG